MNLSVVLATYNEEKNIGSCLDSVKNIADEIVIVDGSSTDNTVAIAKKYQVRVIITDNPAIFHINKQKALQAAKGDWILQLDADERASPELAAEIKQVINMNQKQLEEYQQKLPERELFLRHEMINSKLKSQISNRKTQSLKLKTQKLKFNLIKEEEFVAFYLPRLNYFLGRFLRYGGVYPDGSIRLVKKGRARFPCRDVHEVMEVDGRVGWLQNPLLHYDSPTFKRYIERNNRYINMIVCEFEEQKLKKNFINFLNFVLYQPLAWFFSTQIRHKGILDGWQGIVFSLFSALRFPRAYIKYLTKKN